MAISEKTLITREESASLKGLLILLIILGHCRGINLDIQGYLYCFHVQCFFILPFLYPSKPLTRKNLLNLGLKLLWPYYFLYTLLITIAILVFHESYFTKSSQLIPGINNILLGFWSYITGGTSLINKYCGSIFLWFLPCFFSMTIIKMWLAESEFNTNQKIILFVLGTICFLIYSVLLFKNGFLPKNFFNIAQAVSPFSVFQGLGYFTLGSFAKYLIKNSRFRSLKVYWPLFFIFSILFFILPDNQIVFRLCRLCLPIIFFLSIYNSRYTINKFKPLQRIGNHSLAMYLISSTLCIGAGVVLPAFFIQNPIGILFQFVIILMISFILALLINKISILRILLFPNGEDINSFQKKLYRNPLRQCN